MPLISVTTNIHLPSQIKQDLAGALTELLCRESKSRTEHIHIQIQDGVFFSFGGNFSNAAVNVTVTAAAKQIAEETRHKIVMGLLATLATHVPDLRTDRVFTTFQDLPVEKMAVGDAVMVFESPKAKREGFQPFAPSPPPAQ